MQSQWHSSAGPPAVPAERADPPAVPAAVPVERAGPPPAGLPAVPAECAGLPAAVPAERAGPPAVPAAVPAGCAAVPPFGCAPHSSPILVGVPAFQSALEPRHARRQELSVKFVSLYNMDHIPFD